MRKPIHVPVFSILALLILITGGCSAAYAPEDKRPNILIIVTDDQRYDTMEYMPETKARIFDEGGTFTNGFITTPLCCPSRSSILTGMYAHNHGVHNNDMKLDQSTIVELMQESGYYTGLVGKYLNYWKGEPRPEFDYWVSYSKGETRYYNPRLNVNGKWIRHQDQYVTYALGDYAIDFIKKAGKKNQPFFLLYTPNAPHDPATPAKEDRDLLTDLPPYRPPSFNEADISDKPEWLASQALLTDEEIKTLDAYRRDQILTLVSLDRTLAKVLDELKDQGEMDNTFILFLSDNGKFWGEHRITSKNGIYDEASRVPFAIRYPPLIAKPYLDEHIVANIDIAPTCLELAGVPIPENMDGKSLLGLYSKNTEWREGILLEGWPDRGIYTAVHTANYVYSETTGDLSEFYDLVADPFQLENLINDPKYQEVIQQHKDLLLKLEQESTHPATSP
jgi:N-acetylglucosamine-6-sulfatase